MKLKALSVLPAVLGLWAGEASAVTTIYTSSAAFLPNVAAGSYTNTFTGPATPSAAGSYNFSQGAFAYTVAGIGQQPGTWINGSIIGNNYPNFLFTVTFTSGNVTAIGADFFIMDAAGGFLAAPVTVTLSDGTVSAFSPTSLANTYRGFTSTTTIASLTMSAPTGANRFNAIDNLTVGTVTPIPEPTTSALLGLGMVALLFARRQVLTPK